MWIPYFFCTHKTSHCKEPILALGEGPRRAVLLGDRLEIPICEVYPNEVAVYVLLPILTLNVSSSFPNHKAELHFMVHLVIPPQVQDLS